jgi:hypothetical protein
VQVVWLRNASDVQLFGYGGNACPMKSYPSGFADYPTSLFRVEGSTNISLVSLTSYEMGKKNVPFFILTIICSIKTGSGQT